MSNANDPRATLSQQANFRLHEHRFRMDLHYYYYSAMRAAVCLEIMFPVHNVIVQVYNSIIRISAQSILQYSIHGNSWVSFPLLRWLCLNRAAKMSQGTFSHPRHHQCHANFVVRHRQHTWLLSLARGTVQGKVVGGYQDLSIP